MGATKIMIIRHAEKPGTYNGNAYAGINPFGEKDDESLITLGWERAGGIANLFDPTNSQFQNPALAKPDAIYAADPTAKDNDGSSSNGDEASQRPYQTISALAEKMGVLPNLKHSKNHYPKMISHALSADGIVLISWQHQDILPKESGDDCIVNELLIQTGSSLTGLPTGPWPADRYDIVLVFDRPSGSGPFTDFTQVPQLLLASDSATPIS